MSTKNHIFLRLTTMFVFGVALLPAQATYYFTSITNAATGASVTSTLDPDGSPVVTLDRASNMVDSLDSLLEDSNGQVYKKSPDKVPDLTSFSQTSKTLGEWTSIVYTNGLFVACSDNGQGVAWSENGTNWVAGTGMGDAWFEKIIYAEGRYIAGCGWYSNHDLGLWYSDDGKSWTQSDVTYGPFNALTYGNGYFWAACYSNYYPYNDYYRSPDGSSWTQIDSLEGINSMAYGDGKFLAATHIGIYASTNAVNWSIITNVSADFVVFDNHRFFIANIDRRFYLYNGQNFIVGNSPVSVNQHQKALSAVNGRVYLWGAGPGNDDAGSLYSTTDGLSWVKENGNLPFVGLSMASDGHIVVAGAFQISGKKGLWVSTSKDGYSYTPLATKEYVLSSATSIVNSRLPDYVPRSEMAGVAATIVTNSLTTPNSIVSALGNLHDTLGNITNTVSRSTRGNLIVNSRDSSLTNTIESGEITFDTPMYTADSVDDLFNSTKQTLYDPLDTRVSEVESSLEEKAETSRVVPWITYTNNVKVVLDQVEVTSSNVTWRTADGLNYLRRDPSPSQYVECVWKTSFSANTLNGSLDDTDLSFGDWYDLIKFTRVSSEIYSPVVYTEDIVPRTDFILENKADKSRCSYYWTVAVPWGEAKPFSIYSRSIDSQTGKILEIWREDYSLENRIEIYYDEGSAYMDFGSTYETYNNEIVFDNYSRSANSISMAGRYFSKVMNAVSGARNLVDVLPTTASTNSITLVNEAYNYLSQDNASVYSITLPLLTSDGTARVSYFVFQCISASGITVNVATRTDETLIYPSGDSSYLTPSVGTNIYRFEEVMPNKFLVTKTLGVEN